MCVCVSLLFVSAGGVVAALLIFLPFQLPCLLWPAYYGQRCRASCSLFLLIAVLIMASDVELLVAYFF